MYNVTKDTKSVKRLAWEDGEEGVMESHLSRVRGLKRRRESDGEEDGEEGEVTVVEVADTGGEGEDTGGEEGVMFRELEHAHRVGLQRVTLLYIM